MLLSSSGAAPLGRLTTCAFALTCSALMGGCRTVVPSPNALGAQQVADSSQVDSVPESPVGLAPVTNWKSERKRLAMLGLSYKTGRAVRVSAEAEGVLAGADADEVPILLARGRVALEENRALDAIALFTKVVLLDATVPDHYLSLGLALRAFKLESQATAAWETGLELEPSHVGLLYRTADMAYRYGDKARALRLHERTLEFDADHAPTWERLARLRFFAESDAEAWGAIHRAEALGGSVPPLLRVRLAARSPEPVR